MKDQDLKKLLGTVTPPAADEAARGRALHRATLALSQPANTAAPEESEHAGRRVSYGWVTACVVMLIAGLVMIGRFGEAREADGGADLRTLGQVEELFPGQLNAVIERDGEVRLDLVGQAAPGATDQPLLVQLEGGGQRLRVLSYSGRSITVELKGRRITFEALVTSEGGVVLSGEDFAWSSTQPKPLAGYRIQARSLSAL